MIKASETDRELMLHMELFLEAQREFRDLFTMVEGEQIRKLREFRETADRALVEAHAGVGHIERGREEQTP